MTAVSHSFLPDSGLSDSGADVEARLNDYAARMTIDDLRGLMDPVNCDLFERAMQEIAADSGTIWLVDEGRTKLTVAYSHRSVDLFAKELPLDEGLISLVLASEQAICENKVYEHAEHSKRIDNEIGMITCAMIAAPFYLGGSLRGVLSCVQWKENEGDADPPGFSAVHLKKVQGLSTVLERLLNYQLLRIIFDLHA